MCSARIKGLDSGDRRGHWLAFFAGLAAGTALI
jgi:hypothetical protein